MENYFKSKKSFFDNAKENSIAIINNEDYYSDRIVSDYKGKLIRYGKNNGYTFDKITMSTTMVTQRVNNQTNKEKKSIITLQNKLPLEEIDRVILEGILSTEQTISSIVISTESHPSNPVIPAEPL